MRLFSKGVKIKYLVDFKDCKECAPSSDLIKPLVYLPINGPGN